MYVLDVKEYISENYRILIVLRFNDMSTLVGHFVSLPEKGRKEIEKIVEEMKERDR